MKNNENTTDLGKDSISKLLFKLSMPAIIAQIVNLLYNMVDIILVTDNLAVGVIAGVFFSAIFFATKISKVKVTKEIINNNYVFYFEGQIFFASIDTMIDQLEFKQYDKDILLDFSKAHLWDDSAVDAIDTMVRKFEDKGNTVYVDQLNADSRKIVKELSQLNEQHLT